MSHHQQSGYWQYSNGLYLGDSAQEGPRQHGPNDFADAAAQAGLSTQEHYALTRRPFSAAPSTAQQAQGPTNRQPQVLRNARAHQQHQSLQHLPQVAYLVEHGQGTYPQYPILHPQDQVLHPPQVQSQSQSLPPAAQATSAAGGSRVGQPSAEADWQKLLDYSTYWDSNALEPSRRDGESILMDFAQRGTGNIYCRVPTSKGLCGYSNVKKERFLHHIRKEHLNFLPFVCGGGCGTETCPLRFACETSRKEHVKPRKVKCSICRKEIYSQNFPVHSAKCIKARST